MAEESAPQPAPETTNTTVFPVVLYDGDKEINSGDITIHSDLVYKEFKVKLTELIGISYNNLTTYLVENKKSNIPRSISPERRKILITGKVNFSVIIQEQNCYFLVVLKHSRKNRDRQLKHDNYRELGFQIQNQNQNQINSYYYNDQFNELMFQRENYESNVNLNNFPAVQEVYPRVSINVDRSLCLNCTVAQSQGIKAEFHCCVYDGVITGFFRSPFGLIARPR